MNLNSPTRCEHIVSSLRHFNKALEIRDGLKTNSKVSNTNKLSSNFEITFDLEDGVGHNTGLSKLNELLNNFSASSNSEDLSFGLRVSCLNCVDELLAIKDFPKLNYITIPKVPDSSTAKKVASLIADILGSELKIHFLIETPGALRGLSKIAKIPNVAAFDFGIMDYAAELGLSSSVITSPLQFTNPQITLAKCELVRIAKEAGIVPTHNVTLDFQSSTQTFEDASTAYRYFGFERMWSIHPKQISQILAAFAPTAAEIKEATAVLKLAKKLDYAPVSYQGKLYDRASYRILERVLKVE